MLPAFIEMIIYRDNTCMLTVNVKFYCFVLFPNFALKQNLGQSYSNFSEERAVSVLYLVNQITWCPVPGFQWWRKQLQIHHTSVGSRQRFWNKYWNWRIQKKQLILGMTSPLITFYFLLYLCTISKRKLTRCTIELRIKKLETTGWKYIICLEALIWGVCEEFCS